MGSILYYICSIVMSRSSIGRHPTLRSPLARGRISLYSNIIKYAAHYASSFQIFFLFLSVSPLLSSLFLHLSISLFFASFLSRSLRHLLFLHLSTCFLFLLPRIFLNPRPVVLPVSSRRVIVTLLCCASRSRFHIYARPLFSPLSYMPSSVFRLQSPVFDIHTRAL